MDETKAREYYIKIKTIHDHIDRCTEQISSLDERFLELQSSLDDVQRISALTAPTESLVPIANGIFVSATLQPSQEVFVNVGSDVVVKRSVTRATELLLSQQEKLSSFREKLVRQREELVQVVSDIEREVEGLVDNV